jgi:hypothetical protein
MPDFVAISINNSSYPPNAKLYCNSCNCNLVLIDPQTEEWYCNRCHISYFPNKGEKVKRANKFETPGPATDAHGNIINKEKIPPVAMIGDNNTANARKSKLPASIQALKERAGVNLTDFNSTVDGESL